MTDAEDELEVLFRAEYRGLVRALAVVAGDAALLRWLEQSAVESGEEAPVHRPVAVEARPTHRYHRSVVVPGPRHLPPGE